MRILLLITLMSLAIAACDVDVDSDDDQSPTPIVITSTPADDEAGSDATATPDGEEAPTATDAGEDEGEPGTPTEAADAPTATAGEGEPTEDSSQGNDETRAEVEQIAGQVVELRGLELVDGIDEQIIDREELESRIEEIIAEEYTPEQARIDTLSYWLLRLIPDESLDLYQLQIDLLGEQVAGYYDPETDELVVVTADGTLSAVDKVTLAHEIVHALQDQHFDLVAIDEHSTDLDHAAAVTALIEGDATLSMTDYMLNYLDPMDLIDLLGESLLGGQEYEVLENAPRYIADGLVFSYEAGQAFATTLHEEGGYPAIDAAFADPPQSTEQIMHPEKYIGPERDEPIAVENPDVSGELGEGWEVVNSDALGEWDLQIMLEENGIAAPDAATAAQGWGGSWFDIYESDAGSLALLTTRWDTEQDATEFGDALLASFDADAEFGAIWDDGERFYSAVASSDTVVLISGTDEASVSAVLALMSQTV